MISKTDFIGVPSLCHMAFFTDPGGNDLMLHHRYAPYEEAGSR